MIAILIDSNYQDYYLQYPYNYYYYPYNNYYYSWYNYYPVQFTVATCNACPAQCPGQCGLYSGLYACKCNGCPISTLN